nr:fucolectin-like [Anolis sagrei ordinatus]
MFVAWIGLLSLALLAGAGQGQSCLPWATGYGTNVAKGHPAFQSSTYEYVQSLVAWKAVDGNCDGNLDHVGSCTHTKYDYEPWWYVDLGSHHSISTVVVKNRGNCCGERLRGAQIRVGDFPAEHSKHNPLCGTIQDTRMGSINTVHCHGLKGRFVSVNIPGRNEFLTLCEVEVYGVKAKGPCCWPHAWQYGGAKQK